MYVQQGVRKIVVVVKGEGMVAAAGTDEKDPNEVVDSDVVEKKGKMSRRKKRIIITNTTHTLAIAKQSAYLYLNYALSRVSARNGDQALQDNLSRKVEIYKDVTNFASSLAMGYTYGKWGGTAGAVIGTVLAGTQTAMSTAVKYGERYAEYDIKLFKQNNAIEYQRARANLAATTGRLR